MLATLTEHLVVGVARVPVPKGTDNTQPDN
jgi:hypothetical protein